MNKTAFLQDFIARLKAVLMHTNDSVALHEPDLQGEEWHYVKECLDSGYVSSVGAYVQRFASKLESYTGAKYVIPTVTGTAALHLCLRLAGVQAHDEVLVPALTFIATANAVSYCGAIPHLVDCSEHTLGVHPGRLDAYLSDICEMRGGECWNRRTNRRLKAVIAMHALGHPVEMDLLISVCQKYALELIEDAAESLGSRYKGQHTGTFGRLGALSFNGNKVITTGGGGAVLTNDEELAKQALHLTTVAKRQHPWQFDHDDVGYNYRMPNLNAALGLAQLEQLPEFLRRKRKLASAYRDAFRSAKHARFLSEPPFAVSNYWLNAIVLDETVSPHLDELLKLTNQIGIMTRPLWTPLHKQIPYRDSPRMDLSVTERVAHQVINIPSSAHLGEAYE